jgi:hypothetical protein
MWLYCDAAWILFLPNIGPYQCFIKAASQRFGSQLEHPQQQEILGAGTPLRIWENML